MRSLLFATLLVFFAPYAFAWGCPPWVPCGKFKIISADPEYGAAVDIALVTPRPSQQQADTSAGDSGDVEQRIVDAKAAEIVAYKNRTLQMMGNVDDFAIQQELAQRPGQRFWGFDWGFRGF